MMSVVIRVGGDGCVRAVRAAGHAGDAPAGANVACGAASAVLRAAAEALGGHAGLGCDARAERPGSFSLRLDPPPASSREWVRGVTDVLLRGCLLIEDEFPGAVRVRIDKER